MPTLLCAPCQDNVARLRTLATEPASGESPQWCVTLNLEMVSRADRDRGYEEALRAADLMTADGQPIVWWSRRCHAACRRIERTTGVDIVDAVLRDPAWGRFGVIGGHEPRATIARYPGADERCAFVADEQITEASIDNLAQHIADGKPDVTLVALGVPKQDRICRALRERGVATRLLVGVGGSFEILGPAGRRCPAWLARLGLEWLFRLLREPRRLWHRYLVTYPRGCRALLSARGSHHPTRPKPLLQRLFEPDDEGGAPSSESTRTSTADEH